MMEFAVDKFTTALEEMESYRTLLLGQVKIVFADSLSDFVNNDVKSVKEV